VHDPFAVGVHPRLGVVRLDRRDRINAKRQSVAESVAVLITARLAIALYLARWRRRCPFCHQPHPPSHRSMRRFTCLS
jgi:hypothetical protein